MATLYGLLADTIVAFHAAYVAVVVLGLLAVVVGLPLGWRWVRNPWFRVVHLTMICFVAFEAMIDMECPLTVWERDLRALAGQPVSEATFVGRLMNYLLFYEAPEWAFTLLYVGLGALVLGLYLEHLVRLARRAGRVEGPAEAVACRACGQKCPPTGQREMTRAGRVTFWALLLVFWPLCFIGLRMREGRRYCGACGHRITDGAPGADPDAGAATTGAGPSKELRTQAEAPA